MDLLVNLYDMGAKPLDLAPGLSVRRALSPDRDKVLDFVGRHWPAWTGECAAALARSPAGCFVAVEEHKIVGFACYDATARGYFGPVGVAPDQGGRGVGRALLYAALDAMREDGYGYAVIGWMDSALEFYEKSLKVFPIPDSQPRNTVYQRLTLF